MHTHLLLRISSPTLLLISVSKSIAIAAPSSSAWLLSRSACDGRERRSDGEGEKACDGRERRGGGEEKKACDGRGDGRREGV
jgi:hypothetical protein